MDAFRKVEKEYECLIRLGKDPAKLVNLLDLRAEIDLFQKNLPEELPQEMLESQRPILLEDTLSAIKGKLKVQNEWIRGQLKRYSDAMEQNSTMIIEVNQISEAIEHIRPRLDSAYLEYERVIYDLAIGQSILLDTIRKLREFSLRTWPKNFTPAFEREFGTPERQEISQPTGEGWSTNVYYVYPDGPSDVDFIRYANPIPINEFSVEAMKRQGPVNQFKSDPEKIYSVVDEQAEFPGGMSALMNYIRNNFHIPQTAQELGISGKMYVKFIIREDGSVSDVKMAKSLNNCPECDREAIRVIKSMPKWKPAKVNGRAVNMRCSLPIEIDLR